MVPLTQALQALMPPPCACVHSPATKPPLLSPAFSPALDRQHQKAEELCIRAVLKRKVFFFSQDPVTLQFKLKSYIVLV